MGEESPVVVVVVEEVEVEEVLGTVAGLAVKQSIEMVCQAMYRVRETVTTARQKKSSSTTHGPVISHACISSNRPLPLLWRH